MFNVFFNEQAETTLRIKATQPLSAVINATMDANQQLCKHTWQSVGEEGTLSNASNKRLQHAIDGSASAAEVVYVITFFCCIWMNSEVNRKT